jgi:hypothetical protein
MSEEDRIIALLRQIGSWMEIPLLDSRVDALSLAYCKCSLCDSQCDIARENLTPLSSRANIGLSPLEANSADL